MVVIFASSALFPTSPGVAGLFACSHPTFLRLDCWQIVSCSGQGAAPLMLFPGASSRMLRSYSPVLCICTETTEEAEDITEMEETLQDSPEHVHEEETEHPEEEEEEKVEEENAGESEKLGKTESSAPDSDGLGIPEGRASFFLESDDVEKSEDGSIPMQEGRDIHEAEDATEPALPHAFSAVLGSSLQLAAAPGCSRLTRGAACHAGLRSSPDGAAIPPSLHSLLSVFVLKLEAGMACDGWFLKNNILIRTECHGWFFALLQVTVSASHLKPKAVALEFFTTSSGNTYRVAQRSKKSKVKPSEKYYIGRLKLKALPPYLEQVYLSENFLTDARRQIRLQFFEHLENWFAQSLSNASAIVAAKKEELSSELQLRIHLHEPRRERIEKDVYHVRMGTGEGVASKRFSCSQQPNQTKPNQTKPNQTKPNHPIPSHPIPSQGEMLMAGLFPVSVHCEIRVESGPWLVGPHGQASAALRGLQWESTQPYLALLGIPPGSFGMPSSTAERQPLPTGAWLTGDCLLSTMPDPRISNRGRLVFLCPCLGGFQSLCWEKKVNRDQPQQDPAVLPTSTHCLADLWDYASHPHHSVCAVAELSGGNGAELRLHNERLARHCAGLVEALNAEKAAFFKLRHDQNKVSKTFRHKIQDMENMFLVEGRAEKSVCCPKDASQLFGAREPSCPSLGTLSWKGKEVLPLASQIQIKVTLEPEKMALATEIGSCGISDFISKLEAHWGLWELQCSPSARHPKCEDSLGTPWAMSPELLVAQRGLERIVVVKNQLWLSCPQPTLTEALLPNKDPSPGFLYLHILFGLQNSTVFLILRLVTLSNNLHSELINHMEVLQVSLRSYRQYLEEMLGKLREANTDFLKSCKLFANGGNFSPEELDVFLKRLQKESGRIDFVEGLIMIDMEKMESSYLEQATEVINKFENRFRFLAMDRVFMEKIQRFLTNIQVKIKSEVAKSNLQTQTLNSQLEKLTGKIDACAHPNVDKESITPELLYKFAQFLTEELKKRSKYLNCLLVNLEVNSSVHDHTAQGSLTASIQSDSMMESKTVVMGVECTPLMNPCRMGKPFADDAAVSMIKQLAGIQRVRRMTEAQIERGRLMSGTGEVGAPNPVQTSPGGRVHADSSPGSPNVNVLPVKKTSSISKRVSGSVTSIQKYTRQTRVDRKVLIFGERPKENSNEHFKGIIFSIVWDNFDNLMGTAEEFYKKDKHQITRPEFLQDTYDQCLDVMGQKLTSYLLQADEYHIACISEFRDQLKIFEEQLPHITQLVIDTHLKDHEQLLRESTDQIRHHLQDQLQKWDIAKDQNKAKLCPSLGHPHNLPQLEALCQEEVKRQSEQAEGIHLCTKELESCVIECAQGFVSTLADATEKILVGLDNCLTVDDVQQGSRSRECAACSGFLSPLGLAG
ncbi:hypothetical protein EYD10_12334 [Varanus komodoensis]|nr:hypothetical protein EYD10_12334 [Varanus komodoensis]